MNLEEQLTAEQFYNNFVADDRFVKYILGGLKTTLLVTLFAVLLGIFLGFLVGTVRSTYERTGKLGVLNVFCRAYLSVIRGTPVTVQLMITYYFIFSSPTPPSCSAAILAFGINSGAYVAEIFRSGIMSIDKGSVRGGKKPGLQLRPDQSGILSCPRPLKMSCRPLCNEFIALLKETSVSGFIALQDLTRGADIIRSRTYNVVLPLFTVALIYWMIVTFLTYMVGKLETRLRKNEKR